MRAKQIIAGTLIAVTVASGMVATPVTSQAIGSSVNEKNNKPKAETRKEVYKEAKKNGAKVFKVTSKASAKKVANKVWARWENNKPSRTWAPKVKYQKYERKVYDYLEVKATKYYGMPVPAVALDTKKEIKEDKQELALQSKIVKEIKKYIADHRKDYQLELDNGEMSPSEVDAECLEDWLVAHCEYAYTSKENTETQARKKYPKDGHKRTMYVDNAWLNGTYKANCGGGSAYAYIFGSWAGYKMAMKTGEGHEWAVMKVTDVNGRVYAKGIDATSDAYDGKWTKADEMC